MQISIQSRNLVLPEQIEDIVRKKLEKVSRKVKAIPLVEAVVELSREQTRSASHRFVAEVTLNYKGTIIRAEERGPDLMTVIDAVSDLLDRRVAQLKGLRNRHEAVRKAGRAESIRYMEVTLPEEAPPAPSEEEGQVVRVKRFPVKPMSLEEAIEQMRLLGHDFFLFLDSETGTYSVVYRRRDGNYGVIVPEPG